ncbi:MAG: sortase [Lachnospiraceae bacterium]|nr:sortase [Lachnospiraceae bacterium]
MRRRTGLCLMELGTVLMMLALFLFLYNRWEAGQAQEAAEQAVAGLKQAMETAESSSFLKEVSSDGEEESVLEMDGYAYIGILSISRFGLELPVMWEWSYAGLKLAPGRYSGKAADGDLVICAHNYERHFGKISTLEAGDEIIFTSVDGRIYQYEVTEVLILEPTDIEELMDGEWDLSLFTCTYGGRTRVVVRCIFAGQE